MGVQVAGSGTDGAGKERVVGIEPDEDLAARLEKAAMRGVGRTLVLAGEAADTIAIGGQNSRGFVGRSAVDYDDLEIRVVLGEDAFERFRQVARHIERRRNDGNQGKGGGIHGHAHYNNLDTEWTSCYTMAKPATLARIWIDSTIRVRERIAFSASSDQPNRRRPGRQLRADHPRRLERRRRRARTWWSRRNWR